MRIPRLRSTLIVLTITVSGVVGAACSKKEEPPPPPRTAAQQRTVDSTIGASALPGARGVQGALKAADSAAARQKRLDSIAAAP